MHRLCLLFVACGASAVAGLDCEAARGATDSTCSIFGWDSQPCHMLRLHHTAKCVHVGGMDLGESAEPGVAASAPPASLAGALKAEQQAASKGDIVETIRLANEVYDKAKQMCSCHPGLAPAAAAREASSAVTAASAATAAVQKAEAKQPGATVAAPAAAAVPVVATATSTPTSKSQEEVSGLKQLEKKTGLPAAAAAELEKKAAVNSDKVTIDPDTQKVKDSESEKAEEKKEKQVEAAGEQQMTQTQKEGEIAKATEKAAARGQDPVKAAKKARQEQVEQAASKEAKEASKGKLNSEQINAGIATAKAEKADEERKHVQGMMSALPAGQGLRQAFEKIEEARVAPSKPDGDSDADSKEEIEKAAEKEEGKAPGESNKNLSKEAKQALDQQEMAKPKSKPLEDPKKLEKMQKSIEKAEMPGAKSDKAMYGKSSGELNKEMAGAEPAKEEMAKAGETAKQAQDMKNMEKAEGGPAEEDEVVMLA